MTPARAGRPALSVLIPTLNEAAALPTLLAQLADQRGLRCEVLIADGGSTDRTAAVALKHGARLVQAPRGRAAQLNAAAAAAAAPWLLCLHADSQLTATDQLASALACLRTGAAASKRDVAGHWPLRFLRSQPGHDHFFRQLEAKSASNRPGTVNGDQGLLIHRDFLQRLGGFDASLPYFEDQRLARKISAQGRWLLLPGVLKTSARRFETEGHGARLVLMALIVGAEAAGLDDWLSALPALYREQGAASQLDWQPFARALVAHIAALPASRRRAVWQRAGRLVSDNAWQLALALDLRTGLGSLPLFDRHLAPLFARPGAARWLAAGLRLALTAASLRAAR